LCCSHLDDGKHIYTNIREMDELNSRPFPPVPSSTDVPRRDLNNGWLEYETEAGRTYFYNFETGKSQWIPPRFIRTPAQVQVYVSCDRRGSSSGHTETRESVRTIKCGNMEFIECVEQIKSRRRDWMVNFMYLTSAHLILYKDEKSAEKHGNHYAAPRGVCDLKGASVSWLVMEKEKRKRKVIQLELSNGCRYLFRSANDVETREWFESLRTVISRLVSVSFQKFETLLSQGFVLEAKRPIPLYDLYFSRRHTQTPSSRADSMAHSSIEYTATEEPRPSRESILEKLIRFFRNRPSVESLKEKGIYKHEPVFGSTLSAICQLENSLVPKFIRTVTELIESRGLEIDGLYRVSGNLSAVQKIRCQVDQDKYAALVSEEDVHVLTGALKLFFRELAEPVFPPSLTKDYLNIQNPKQRFKRFDELLRMLPPENRETLKMLLRHLLRVASHSDKNRMQIHNLAIMFGPTLFIQSFQEEIPTVQSNSHLAFNMIMQGQIVEYLLIEHNKFEALQGPVQTHPH
uniref:Rho GTPase-activating protein 12 n=1 Tax=Angiostrongylus cantonensis TaxID=6313 RepID=A0A158PAW8_ANGCA